MASGLARRGFVGVVVAAVAIAVVASGTVAEAAQGKRVTIIGISCSPRAGKTTAAALTACLEAAKAVSPNIDTELIELAGMAIPGSPAAGVALPAGHGDDFAKLIPRLSDGSVGGIIIGSPVYFSNMSSLCKAFLDRCIAFRKNDFALSGKVAGVIAVGGARNGGQELTVQSIQAALLCQGMILVGSGKPTARIGATLWSQDGEIAKDEFGLSTAKDLGRHVAEVALRLAGAER